MTPAFSWAPSVSEGMKKIYEHIILIICCKVERQSKMSHQQGSLENTTELFLGTPNCLRLLETFFELPQKNVSYCHFRVLSGLLVCEDCQRI
jgi:hypothetical protein